MLTKNRVIGCGHLGGLQSVHFLKDERGSMTIFSLYIFIGMLMAGGMAIDLMRFEKVRTGLQYNLDRAVLAAAALSQTSEPEAVVENYMETSGLTEVYTLEVESDTGLNYRTVSATVTTTLDNVFLNMVGLETLTASASSSAEERIMNVEISLVTDISGSMGSYSRLTNLKTAAKEFVDTVLTADNDGKISVSMIPYSGHVNVGDNLFSKYNVDSTHSYSTCVEFDNDDFLTTALSSTDSLEQMQHFYSSYYRYDHYYYDDYLPYCRNDSISAIVPLTKDATALKASIDSLTADGSTAIHMGMKWGLALLDPGTQSVVADLITDGDVSNDFADRPAAFDDSDTLKIVIILTDGSITSETRIQDQYMDTEAERTQWSQYGLWAYSGGYYSSYYQQSYFGTYPGYLDTTQRSSSEAGDMLLDLCDDARDEGIVVFSIGFEAPYSGQDLMESCAYSTAHFYDVDGVEISTAFQAIASTINKLKLTQ